MQWDDALGLDPEVGVAVPARHRLPRDLQHVAEALRGDETQPRKPLLEERVGGHGGAVGDGGHGGPRHRRGRGRRGAAREAQDLADPVDHAD